ncbi:unnamed protein product [Ranitomeya imitator]|uniref:ribonuclease H n=1 Tax=Ranitomeya imitator TaxID=111125 RepID=A0ABN9L6K9_9NEOB|nr:unnamed protein product [Ranitomeya imitator]
MSSECSPIMRANRRLCFAVVIFVPISLFCLHMWSKSEKVVSVWNREAPEDLLDNSLLEPLEKFSGISLKWKNEVLEESVTLKIEGSIGGLSTAFQNAVDKPLMLLSLSPFHQFRIEPLIPKLRLLPKNYCKCEAETTLNIPFRQELIGKPYALDFTAAIKPSEMDDTHKRRELEYKKFKISLQSEAWINECQTVLFINLVPTIAVARSALQILDTADCEQPTSFATLRDNLPSFKRLLILSFVSIDISRVGAMIHVSPLGATALQDLWVVQDTGVEMDIQGAALNLMDLEFARRCGFSLESLHKFPKGRLFNLSVPEHAAMRSYIKESLEKGHIRPSSSPLGAGFFFVAKKDGSLRPCIDYRLLNKITVKFQYPLPLMSDLFARIKGASWFTKIDLRGAYNLVRIKQGDEWKTAFNTPEGHFEYLVMPFGLSNAPSVFQSFMHDIFREYLDRFMIVYLDDILVFSDDWESHVKQVRMVFQVLRANSLFVKGSKCLFGVQKVSFLGFIFSPSTIEMDPVKVQAIYDWTKLTSVKSLQKFLGFANFYRRFIANFSSVAKPLTDLTKKGADVVNWSSAAVEAFQELKRRFSSAPVLCQPDVSLPFQVEVDASEIGAGAVLSQRSSDGSVMKPCAFFSRKFSPAERNYDVGNRDLLAMKLAFEQWRHWLEGAKHRVVVLTDHKNLTYLESAKRLNPRQARWSLFSPVLILWFHTFRDLRM